MTHSRDNRAYALFAMIQGLICRKFEDVLRYEVALFGHGWMRRQMGFEALRKSQLPVPACSFCE